MPKLLLAIVLGARLTACQVLHLVDWLEILCNDQPFSIDLRHTSGALVPVFYRSVDYLEVGFQVSDPNGSYAVPPSNVTLSELSRRLAEGFAGNVCPLLSTWWAQAPSNAGEAAISSPQLADASIPATAAQCQEYFLLDGRHPADIPDTWAEARIVFDNICLRESEMPDDCPAKATAVFEGRPHAAEVFYTDVPLCELLARSLWPNSSLDGFFAAPPARRTKGSYGTGSGYYSGGRDGAGQKFSGTSYSSTYSSSTRVGYFSVGGRYPYGYWSRPYGYSGFAATSPATMYFVMRPRYGYGWYYLGHGGVLQAEQVGPDVCDDEQECMMAVSRLVRDDLMDKSFYADPDDGAPLVLTITSISGRADDQAFNRTAMCPPPGWHDGDPSWTPPPTTPQLFFALGQVDEMEWWEDDLVKLLGGLMGGVLGCIICCYSFRLVKRCCTSVR